MEIWIIRHKGMLDVLCPNVEECSPHTGIFLRLAPRLDCGIGCARREHAYIRIASQSVFQGKVVVVGEGDGIRVRLQENH